MKKILKITNLIGLISLVMLTFYSCNKNDDLVTKDAATGGLVVPTNNIPFKLGSTTVVSIRVIIPQGPGITKIEVYSSYTDSKSGGTTNTVLLKTIDVNGANASKNDTITYDITYADLKAGLLLNGGDLPPIADSLAIGSAFSLTYVTYVGGRKVVNNASTSIGVANAYAGLYQCDGVFHHPTAGDRVINAQKFLGAISVYEVSSTAGDLGAAYGIKFVVNPVDNSVTVVSTSAPVPMLMQAGFNSRYEPSTGKFYVWYYYVGASGDRKMDEVYTPIGK